MSIKKYWWILVLFLVLPVAMNFLLQIPAFTPIVSRWAVENVVENFCAPVPRYGTSLHYICTLNAWTYMSVCLNTKP